MPINIGANFAYNGKLPNFERDSFESKAAMKAFDENSIDEGHLSYCKEDGNIYQYKFANSIDATTGRWRLFKTDIVVDATLNGTSTNAIQNKAVHDALGGKVDKESGKGLSTNDYTQAEKDKLSKAFTTDTTSSGPNQFLAGPINTQGNIHLRKIDSSDLPTMGGASASGAGKAGIVPAPASGKQGAFLRGDGKWESPTFTVPTASATKLGGVKVGTNLSATADGTLSVTTDSNVTENGIKPITSGAVAKLNNNIATDIKFVTCLLYTSPSPRD